MSRYAFMATVLVTAVVGICLLGWFGLAGGGWVLTLAILALLS